MKKILIGFFVILAIVLSLSMQRSETTSITTPLYAQSESQTVIVTETTEDVPWLHVTVETKYTWFSQTSIGKAWTTKTRESEERVNVGKLCIKLDAHKIVEQCLTDANYIEVKDTRKRIATKKKKAFVTAWAENPTIAATTTSLEP